MKKLLLFVIILQGCTISGSKATRHDDWLSESVELMLGGSDVPTELLYAVSPKNRSAAISMLEHKSVISLSAEAASRILDGGTINADTILERAAQSEERSALQREKEAAYWKSKSDHKTESFLMSLANEHKARVEEIRGLKGKMSPYLVRGVKIVGSETGGFVARYSGEKLWISFVALGTHAEVEKQPLVIYLSHEPREVYVSVSLAR